MIIHSLETEIIANTYHKAGRKVEVVGLAALRNGTKTQQAEAQEIGVSRTTLQSWVYRERTMQREIPPELVHFYESPAGLTHLCQLVVALMYTFNKASGCGLATIQMFLIHSGLCKFVASSIGSLQQMAAEMDNNILTFGREEEDRLAAEMPMRDISVVADETFFPDMMVLLMMEPVSNYILTEESSKKRDAASWNDATSTILAKLNAKVIQLTGDEGSGLTSFTKKILGIHKAPDLFHVQQDITKAMGGHLARKVKKSKRDIEECSAQIEKSYKEARKEILSYDGEYSDPAPIPEQLALKIKNVDTLLKQQVANNLHHRQLLDDQQIVSKRRREIGDLYHPFDMTTGVCRSPEELENSLSVAFDDIESVATRNGCSEKQLKRLSKSRHMIPSLKATLAFFWIFTQVNLAELKLFNLDLESLFYKYLLPIMYWKSYYSKCRSKSKKELIEKTIKTLENKLNVRDGPWSSLLEEGRKSLSIKAQECVELFQRSSSCVEGRNGQLSLLHHGHKRLGTQRIRVLKVIHNFGLLGKDGHTPAEQLFGQKPRNLFDYLLNSTSHPGRPRRSDWSRTRDNRSARRVA